MGNMGLARAEFTGKLCAAFFTFEEDFQDKEPCLVRHGF